MRDDGHFIRARAHQASGVYTVSNMVQLLDGLKKKIEPTIHAFLCI